MTDNKADPIGNMPLIEHLRELRSRMIKSLIAIGVFTVAAYVVSPKIFQLLMAPLLDVLGEGQTLIYTAPAEAFLTYIKVALITGTFAASPVIIYQIWKFVMPGLYAQERSYALPFVFIASIFFIGGASFGYLVIFPAGYDFFINNFQTDTINAMIKVDSYLKFSTKLLLAFGVSFELPIVILFLAKMGLVTPGFLWRNFKYAVLIMAVASAFFTPADAFTMLAMLGPLTLLYLLSIGVAWLFGKKRKEEQAETSDES